MKSVLLVVVLLCLSFVSLTAQAVGGGLSVFVPEELYTSGQGTVAFEQGLSTSIGFGDLLSIPIGVAYHAAGSFVLDPAEHPDHVGPDLYGDVLIPSVQVKMHVGLGSLVYVEAHGGGAAAWAFSLRPTASFAQALVTDRTALAVATDVVIKQGLGFGWVAGGAFGVNFGAISVDLGATYRWLRIPLDLSANVTSGQAGSFWSASTPFTSTTQAALLRGLSIQLGGSYKL
ncbi:MAG: hypothetical protein WCG80_08120 [Spirochaetales bacterium]